MTNAPLVVAGRSAETTPEQVRLCRSVSEPSVTDPVEARMRSWIAELCDDPPLVDQLTVDDLSTDCGRASLLRAALVHRRSKQPDVIAEDLRRQLVEDDLLVALRLRQMSGDLSELPWLRIHDVSRARAEAGDPRYRRRAA